MQLTWCEVSCSAAYKCSACSSQVCLQKQRRHLWEPALANWTQVWVQAESGWAALQLDSNEWDEIPEWFSPCNVLLSQVACTCSTVTRRPPSSSASPRLSPAKTHSRLISSPHYHCRPTRCFRPVVFFFSISNLKTEPVVVAVSPEYWSCHQNPQSGESDCHEQAEQRLAFYWKKYSIEI